MLDGEQATRNQAEWILVALASVGTAIIVADTQGRVVSMNPVAEKLTGWPQNEAAGEPLSRIFRIKNAQTPLPVADPVPSAVAAGRNHAMLLARDGTEWHLDDDAVPIRNSGGTIVGTVLVFRDASERRRTERAAEDARAFAEGIVDAIREPLVVLDAELIVRTANRAFFRTFGTTPSRTEGRSFFDIDGAQWESTELRSLLNQVVAQNAALDDLEIDQTNLGDGGRVMRFNARPIPQPADGKMILLAIEDVTEQRRAVRALELSEARYRRLFETAQDGILIVDADTRRVFDANPFLTDLLGYRHDELVGRELWEIGLFRDIEASKAAFRTLQERGYIRYEDLPLMTKDRRHIDVEFVSNVYLVGDQRVIQCNIRDVSDRKKAERALREAHDNLEERVRQRTAELHHTNGTLSAAIAARERSETIRRDLQRRLATAQEDERRRIARELHDQVGQYLAALGLGLNNLEDSAQLPTDVARRIKQLRELTDRIGTTIHDLALEIRPTALDDFGLSEALTSFAEEWSTRSGIRVEFHASGLEQDRLPSVVESTLYRVVQEALTNVFRHAEARRVSLVVQRISSEVIAVVEDDGHGFDPDAGPFGADRLGLLGMRERVELVGGRLTVESALARGTTVIARIPLEVEGGTHDQAANLPG